MMSKMLLGPVMIDIAGFSLSATDRERLLNPLVGGIILFSRNFESQKQLSELTTEIHALRNPELLIAVDHEGGRVQRFKDGFTRLPAMRNLGCLWDKNKASSIAMAHSLAYILAAELIVNKVDFSFAPVLDVDHQKSKVVGDRAFHSNPIAISELTIAFMRGLHQAGMPAVGKHFPGHGYVEVDSHFGVPVDDRVFTDIERIDLLPFSEIIKSGLDGIMPAHVIYPNVDKNPAGFSEFWIRQVLRDQLKFDGIVFSDDLCMEGAKVVGGIRERAIAALEAGCDMVLVCNDSVQADELLSSLNLDVIEINSTRLNELRRYKRQISDPSFLINDPVYNQALLDLKSLEIIHN